MYVALGAVLAAGSVCAQEDTAAQRALYARVEKGLGSYEKVTAKGPEGEALTGWLDGGELVKVAATEKGGTREEFFLDGGKLVFVYREWKKAGARVEERLYFNDEGIFKWLTTEKDAPLLHGEDYAATAESLAGRCVAYGSALAGGAEAGAGSGVTEGKFLRIEEGDYFHWVMQEQGGGEVSFFLLKPDKSVEQVVEEPGKFTGRKCRVTWKDTTEFLPEAGRKVDVRQVLSVEWLK